jgi:uncharacterized protein DUF1573
MKLLSIKMLMLVVIMGTVMTSCSDKGSEKRIAELESRLADLEGGPVARPAATSPTAAPAEKPEGPLPVIEWTGTEHDFGTIGEGEKVSHIYTFKNTGAVPLIIESVRPSCGCTAPNWSKEPIPVGGSGEIEVVFDSKGKPNAQNKTVTVTSNAWPKNTILRFKTFVTPASK